ncbi:unnamed protein product [Cylindrotheca closterium]|uniref:Uncharacterized protein n=1 Tax=Cylindrotheca closterium TaxID=2856 RepID=A0AAD2JMP9_9STRA|nr:unnamed protein product [Cylindrotheca closterium]
MAKETEDTDDLVKPSKQDDKMPSEQIEVLVIPADSEYGSDDLSLGSQNSTADLKLVESPSSEHPQLLVDIVPPNYDTLASIKSSASNSVGTLESNPSVTQNPDYDYDDDVPFSYYAPLKTKERTAPLIDHHKSKKQKKQEKKERKKEIKKVRQEVQQNRKSEQQETSDLESTVEADESIATLPHFSLATSMAGLMFSSGDPYVIPYSSPTFLWDDGEVVVVGEIDDDDDDEDFSIEGLESFKMVKSKRKSTSQNQNSNPPKKKGSSSSSSSSSSSGSKHNSSSSNNNNDKKKKKKRGRRADYEEPEEEDEHETAEDEIAKTPAHPTKDVAARVEAIFTNKDMILDEFDEYIERVGEEQKELEEMLEEQRGRNRSNSVSSKKSSHRGRSSSKPKHSARSQSKGPKARSVSKSATQRRKVKDEVAKHSLDNTLKIMLGETPKSPENRRSSLASGRSKSEFLVDYIRNASNERGDGEKSAPSSPRRKNGKSEGLTLDESIERLPSVTRMLPRRSSSFSKLECVRNKESSKHAKNETEQVRQPLSEEVGEKTKTKAKDQDSSKHAKNKTEQVRQPMSEEVGEKTKTKAKGKDQDSSKHAKKETEEEVIEKIKTKEKAKDKEKDKDKASSKKDKGKKGKADALTLDDSVERPQSISKDLRRQSNSYPDIDRLKSAKPDAPTQPMEGNKLKLSLKTLQSLSEDMLGKVSSKTKKIQGKGKKEEQEALTLDDSVERPRSISKNLRRESNSYPDIDRLKSAKPDAPTQPTEGNKLKLSFKTLQSLSEDVLGKVTSKTKSAQKGKKEKADTLTLDDSVERPLPFSLGHRRTSSSYSDLEGRKPGENESSLKRDSKNGNMKDSSKAALSAHSEHIGAKPSRSKKKAQGKGKKEEQGALTLDDSVKRPPSVSKGMRRQSNSYPKLEGAKHNSSSSGTSSRNSDFDTKKAKTSSAKGHRQKNAKLLSSSEHGVAQNTVKRKGDEKALEPTFEDFVVPLAPPSDLKQSWSSERQLKSADNSPNQMEFKAAALPTDLKRGGSFGSDNVLKPPHNKKHGKAESPSIKGHKKSSKKNQHSRSKSPGAKMKKSSKEEQAGSSIDGSEHVKEKKKLSRTRSKSLTKVKQNSESGKNKGDTTEEQKKKESNDKEVPEKTEDPGSEHHPKTTDESRTLGLLGDSDLDSDLDSLEEFASMADTTTALGSKPSKPKQSESTAAVKKSSDSSDNGDTKTTKKNKAQSTIMMESVSTLEELAGAVADARVDGSEAPKMRKSTGIPNPDLPNKPKKGKKSDRKHGLSATMH